MPTSRKTTLKALPLAIAALLVVLALMPVRAMAAYLDTGVNLGSGYTVEFPGVKVDQTNMKRDGLAAVKKWRQDALNDTSVLWEGMTMRQYLRANGISESDYLNPQWSFEAENIALQRAFEANLYWDHTRPNGDYCFTADYIAGSGWCTGEVISDGPTTAGTCVDLWASEKENLVSNNGGITGHYTFLIDPSVTHYGFAVIGRVGVGESYYGSTSSSATGYKGTYQMRVNVSASDLLAGTFFTTDSVRVGQTQQLDFILDVDPIYPRLIGTWTSDDPGIATVSDSGVARGVSAGVTTMHFSLAHGEDDEDLVYDLDVYSGANPMYRLYNKWTGEHFYTASAKETNDLVKAGWTYEGIGWHAPESSSTPVYRLYNPWIAGGDHHYTTDAEEKDYLVSVGWNYEGIGWYSDDNKTTPLYRQYNPYAATGTHNYTADKAENDHLVSVGWRAEGIGWYGM